MRDDVKFHKTRPHLDAAGVSLIELMIALGVSGFILIAVSAVIQNSLFMSSKIRAKTEFEQLSLDIRHAFAFRSTTCSDALRADPTTPITFAPPMASLPHAESFNYLYLQNNPILAVATVTDPPSYQPYSNLFEMTQMEVRSKGADPSQSGATVNGTLTTVANYAADIYLEAQTYSGETLQTTIPIELYVDPRNDEIVNCKFTEIPLLERAIAVRKGYTIDQKFCADALIEPDDYFSAGVEHRGRTDPAQLPIWNDHMPTRNTTSVGPAPLTSPPGEGRCWVEVVDIPFGENPDDVFVLHNDDGTQWRSDGIGCREENGWELSVCTIDTIGSGDPDATVRVDSGSGRAFCVSNEYWQPHARDIDHNNVKWAQVRIDLMVMCARKNDGK